MRGEMIMITITISKNGELASKQFEDRAMAEAYAQGLEVGSLWLLCQLEAEADPPTISWSDQPKF